MKMPKARAKRYELDLRGGPWKDLRVLIPSGGTMVFSLKGWHGRYDMNGRWHNVHKADKL